MKVTFLGTGTSQGVPVITCGCKVCRSLDFRDKRLRTSIHIEVNEKSFVIDSGPDFRQQMLREQILKLDALIFTHQHKDHTAGLDDVRAFNFSQRQDIPIYGRAEVIEQLKQEFAYVFAAVKYPGVPRVKIHKIQNQQFQVEGIDIMPIEVLHYRLPVFGYRIKNFTYITDANYISDKEMRKLEGTEVLVLNALREKEHISHFSLAEALELIAKVNPRRAYLTHLSHDMGLHSEVSAKLPKNVEFAYDGLHIEC
ncbi:MAG: MBL fold metallo-hydrolase [Bernardetiaceae bacterium]|nr:MBL fold metallo-hydrolase [Bernardetiaceae bacterium]